MSGNRVRILLVEDNQADARLIFHMLNEERAGGVDVEIAESLESALASLSGKEFDIVLLDLTLPDSRGLDTFERIEAEARNVPIIIITGLTDEELAITAVRKGAQDYLLKGDVESRLLLRAIQYAIERKRLLLELQEAHHKVKTLSGLVPICSGCKKIRDDKGFWNQLEIYIGEHSEAEFTHGICPDCAQKYYGGYLKKKELDSGNSI